MNEVVGDGGGAWSVAIFTSRESPAVLAATLDAVVAAVVAAAPRRATVDVLVDSNPATADGLVAWPGGDALASGLAVRLWLVPWRDKACTWNRYLYEIAPPAEVAFFVDGYVRPMPDSLARLATALDDSPDAWAASGVPTVGSSAARQRHDLLADGGLHGNLYALRGRFVRLLADRGFRLPLGLYRNDSLVGAIACFAADPRQCRWDRARTAVVEAATWTNDVAPVAIRAYFKRRMRQAQGVLEIAAMRDHLAVKRLPPERLPATAAALIRAAPPSATAGRGLLDRWLMRRVVRRLRTAGDGPSCDGAARLLRVWNGS